MKIHTFSAAYTKIERVLLETSTIHFITHLPPLLCEINNLKVFQLSGFYKIIIQVKRIGWARTSIKQICVISVGDFRPLVLTAKSALSSWKIIYKLSKNNELINSLILNRTQLFALFTRENFSSRHFIDGVNV